MTTAGFNAKAAKRGRTAVHSNSRYKESKNSVGDMLVDLLHLCASEGIDFGKELSFAFRAHGEDINTDERQHLFQQVKHLATTQLLPGEREELAKVLKRSVQ